MPCITASTAHPDLDRLSRMPIIQLKELEVDWQRYDLYERSLTEPKPKKLTTNVYPTRRKNKHSS
jgi:hypothetical protein